MDFESLCENRLKNTQSNERGLEMDLDFWS